MRGEKLVAGDGCKRVLDGPCRMDEMIATGVRRRIPGTELTDHKVRASCLGATRG
jgi:hypothetical protein